MSGIEYLEKPEEELKTNKDVEIKKRVGRPRKYATEEESKAMQLKQIKESYDRNYEKRYEGREKKRRGRKSTGKTIEDIRERQRETQRRYLERKKLREIENNEKCNENN
jgi:hypothetical protein